MPSSSAVALTAWTVAFLYVVGQKILSKREMRRRNPERLPYAPGPRQLPFIGSLFDIPRSKSALTYIKWREQYGPLAWAVVTGTQYLIVNDYEMIKELFEKKGNIYLNRPHQNIMVAEIGINKGTPLTQYGPIWKQHRRFLNRALMAPVVKKDYSPVMTRKTLMFLKTLLDRPGDFLIENKKMMAEMITEITYGAVGDDEDGGHDYVEMQMEMGRITAGVVQGYWVDFFPWVRCIPSWFPFAQWKRDALRWNKEYNFTRDYVFNSVKRRLLMTNGEGMRRSFVRSMLEEVYSQLESKSEEELQSDETVINHAGFSFFRAGAETTESLVRTFMLAMSLYPEVQARARAEVDAVIGPGRFPNIDDRGFDKMPYLEATVLECIRWHPPAQSLIPHLPLTDDTYRGYFIPKGTTVLGNVWQVSRDIRYYANPSTFYPDRFLVSDEKQGRLSFNPSVLNPWDFAFGFGRRICPGRGLAVQEAWMAAAFILWGFEVKTKGGRTMKGGYKATDEERFNFAFVSQTLPYECEFVPRSEKVKHMINTAVEEQLNSGNAV